MKCPICNIIEMRVTSNNGTDVQLECPSCHEIVTLKIEESTKK